MKRSCACLLLLVACSKPAPVPVAPRGVTTRDSAGVAIVEHPAGALETAPRFRLGTPITTIGGAEADSLHDATDLTQALFLDSLRFVAVHRRSWQLLSFDTTGKVLAVYGRRGKGPGELHDYPLPRRDENGVLLLLNYPPSVMRLSDDLTLVTDILLPFNQLSAQLLMPVRGGALTVSRAPILPRTASEPTQRSAEFLVRVDSAGPDTLATWNGLEWYPVAGNEGGQTFVGYDQREFGKATVIRVWGSRIVVGTNDGWAFDVRDTTGALRQRVVLHESPRLVTDAMKDSIRVRLRADIEGWKAGPSEKANAIANIAKIRFADTVAAYSDAIAAADGSLWVAETVVPTENVRRYAVFTAAGQLARRVEMPARFRLLAADGDRVLVRRLDQEGLGYIDLSRLIPVAR